MEDTIKERFISKVCVQRIRKPRGNEEEETEERR